MQWFKEKKKEKKKKQSKNEKRIQLYKISVSVRVISLYDPLRWNNIIRHL